MGTLVDTLRRTGGATDVERRVLALVDRYVADGVFTHAAVHAGRLGRAEPLALVEHLPGGRDVFDLASLTKALVTTTLVFHVVQDRGMTVDQPLGAWLGADKLPELDGKLLEIKVRSLLRHESGLPAWWNFWMDRLGVLSPPLLADSRGRRQTIVTVLNRIAAAQPPTPGRQLYSDVGFLLLMLGLESALGTDLATGFDVFCRDKLGLDPVSLPLHYGVRLALAERAVPTAFCALRGRQLVGEVHDENCASLGAITSHAGLFGTTAAVALFLERLVQSPAGQALWQANQRALVDPPGDPPNEALMGWRQGADPASAAFGQGLAMGHWGFTGTALWVCSRTRTYAMVLTNRVVSGRTRPGIAAFRRETLGALEPLRAQP